MRLAIAISLLTSSALWGQAGFSNRVVDYIPLTALLKGSDAIVIATARSFTTVGTQAGATLQIVRSVKGDPQPGDVLNADWKVSGLPDKSHQGETGLWFLRRTPDATWTPLPLVNSGVPFVADYFLPVTSTEPRDPIVGSPEERLGAEMAHAVEENPSNVYIWNWTDLLRGDSTEAFEPAYSRLSSARVPVVKAFGIAGLIRLALPSGYRALLGDVEILMGTEFPTDLVAGAFCESKPKADSLEYLKVLALLEMPKFKQCAAEKVAGLR